MSASASSEPDQTMLELFRAEVDMHLPVLSSGLLAMEKGRADRKEIEAMMRAAHSIKGAARIVGIEAAVPVAHVLEDCFSAAKEERITLTSDAVDVLLQGVDVLQRICSPEPDAIIDKASIVAVLDRIASVRDGKMPVSSAISTSPPSAMTVVPQEHNIVFPANLDASTADSLRRQLCEILEQKPMRICIDFSQVDHLSVMAMSLLLSFAKETKSTLPTSAIEARRVAPPILALFRVTGLDDAFGSPE